ncbi:MAG: hypothetical protein SVK08_01965 [Halobacteriota archaeon]|nr:hypothetical protein [Halobacteriota archaeon]
MAIEEIEVKKALKCGNKVYEIGKYGPKYRKPITQDLINEARSGSGVVKILHESTPEPPPVILAPKGTGTSTSAVGTVSGGEDDVIDREKLKKTQPPKPSTPPKKAPSKKKKLKLRGKK